MPTLTCRALTPVLALMTALTVGACDEVTDPLAPETGVGAVQVAAPGSQLPTPASGMRVYTRNVFLGGDTGPLFTLDFGDIGAVLAGVNTFWGQVQANAYMERAQAIAAEIAGANPHVVALQEVARYAEVDLSTGQPVIVGGADFLPVLLNALAVRGLSYDVVVSNPFVQGQLPLDGFGIPEPPFFQPTRILDLSVGEVTLVRSDVQVQGADQGDYQVGLDLGPLSLERGWSRVRVRHRGMPYHVVNTHLETQGIRPVHDAQADELIGSVLAGLNGMTVLVGDLNSDARGPQNAQDNPAWTPTYGKLLTAGFADAWLEAGDPDEGATCCFSPDLSDDSVENFIERIDFVLVRRPGNPRSGSAAPVAVTSMSVLGDAYGDRTVPGGLWPGDHAALFADLAFPGVVGRN